MFDEKRIKTNVKIGKVDYIISSTSDEDYVRSVAEFVDKKLEELTKADKRLSTAMAAILTSVNITDELFRVKEDGETLRGQLLQYADEAGNLKAQTQKLQMENKRLSEENKNLQSQKSRLEAELAQYRRNGRR
ncbi:MAG: cell division protein ZapA [Clostridia bacterium]|nr:cell division protein ZapA [Clostridia bacterium]